MTSILLLRGINVGGHHKLPMASLRALLEKLGCTHVRTYIQSGNAVFEAPAALAAKLPQSLPAAIQKAHGFAPPLILRSAAQVKAALKANPFKAKAAEDALHVGFLADKPSAAAIATLAPTLAPGEAFKVLGAEIHLHLPLGLAKTRLTNAYIDSRLKTMCTVRNWRTVQALLAMAEGQDAVA